MRAPQVRNILSSIPIGESKRVELGPGDTPRTLRNYFLVIAKLDGYVITTRQYDSHISVHVSDYITVETKNKRHRSGRLDGITYGRPKKENDFNWPCLELSKLASYPPELLFRIDMTPRPIAGNTVKPVGFNRGNTNGFKRKHTEEDYD